MPIDHSNVVDFLSIDPANKAVLTISDHYDWEGDYGDPLTMLQEKINRYLEFIESGQILESYPNTIGRKIKIHIAMRHVPSVEGEKFLRAIGDVLNSSGYEFSFQV